MFIKSTLAAGKTLLVFRFGPSEYITPKDDVKEDYNDCNRRYINLVGNRYMHYIKVPPSPQNHGGEQAAIPMHDQLLNLNAVNRIEVVSSETDRWKELKSLFQSYEKSIELEAEAAKNAKPESDPGIVEGKKDFLEPKNAKPEVTKN